VRALRAERSRRAILDAALHLFSTQGFRSTSTRDIAEVAGISTGALYHHFADKELIFQSLLDEYWQATTAPDFPLNVALRSGAFLVYVDVIEFEGIHIRRFYEQIAARFAAFLAERPEVRAKLRPEISPETAAILVTRILVYIYAVEHVFGVPNQFGNNENIVLGEIVDILERGILPPRHDRR
jgi:AcrR family transcriptional regulator